MATDDGISRATAKAVSNLAAGFMFDPATYTYGAEQGFAGLDFYFAGRGGVLGDVDAAIVVSALVFFAPDQVRANWDASRSVMSRSEAASHFAECAHRWAAEHLSDDADWGRLAELGDKIAASARLGAAPLFAGWQAMAGPDDAKAAAVHQMNVLRELRMARHGAAVMVVGLDPGDAVRHRSPTMTGIFGWPDAELPADVAARWDEAEALTHRATDHDYAVLTPGEADELVVLCEEAMQAVS